MTAADFMLLRDRYFTALQRVRDLLHAKVFDKGLYRQAEKTLAMLERDLAIAEIEDISNLTRDLPDENECKRPMLADG